MLKDDLINILSTESISVTQLAARLNISSAMLSYVISGKKQPGVKMLKGLWKYKKQLCRNYLEGDK